MATAYTSSLRLALPVTGELNGTWGDVVNQQITSMVEQAVAGYQSIAITGNTTLTTVDGGTDQSRNMMLKFTGTLTGAADITVPTASKLYFVDNSTTGGFALVVKTSAGTGVTVANGTKMVVYCDGTNVVEAISALGSLTLPNGTANQIQFLNASKVLSGASGLTWDGTYLSAGSIKDAALTSGRVTYAGTSGLLQDSANLTFNGTTLTAAGFSGPLTGNVTGNADTATKLATVRTIWGQNFDGSANVTGALSGVTTISASGQITSTLASGTAPFVITSTTKVANLNVDLLDGADWAAPLAIGSGTPAAGSFTTLSTSSTVTLSGGTANGVLYLNGSKVATSGSALTFDGSILGVAGASPEFKLGRSSGSQPKLSFGPAASTDFFVQADSATGILRYDAGPSAAWGGKHAWFVDTAEGMRLTSTGLGIGTSSPGYKLAVAGTIAAGISANTNGRFRSFNGSNDKFVEVFSDGTNAIINSTYSSTSAGPLLLQVGDTTRVTIDASGNLGLGVTPSAWGSAGNLQLYANIGLLGQTTLATNLYYNAGWKYAAAASPNVPTVYGTDTNGAYWSNAPANGTLNAAATVTERMRLDSSGNLGLGVTPSAWGSAGNLQLYANIGLLGQTTLATNLYYNAGWKYAVASSNVPTVYGTDTNGAYWSNAPANGTLNAAATVTERMRLDASGNLGLGVTPSAWGSGGNIQLSSAAVGFCLTSGGSYLSNTYHNAGYKFIGPGYGLRYDQNAVSGQHQWHTSTVSGTAGAAITFTQAMTLDASGNLMVGTTSTTPITGLSAARITSVSSGDGATIVGGAGNDTLNLGKSGTPSGTFIGFFATSGTGYGNITVNGSGVAYNTSSDYRLKNIAGPVVSSGQYIDALNPVEGTWKADGSTFIGLIAHEVQEVSRTQVATGEKDGTETQAMNYASPELIANMIAELKSLRARVAQLESR